MIVSPWQGKKVAFCGDSVTDAIHVGTLKNYWQFLQEELGLEPLVYGQNGSCWSGLPGQIESLSREHGVNVDAIFILLGTNDFNCGIPLGEWFTTSLRKVNANGTECRREHRERSLDKSTLRGIINVCMQMIKERFPLQQIVLMTPLHRAYAAFSATNVQPDENYANGIGLFLDAYVEVIREAADRWACPLIDLYRDGGLHPLTPSHSRFFHDAQTDLLHPNAEGHRRIAQTMICRMLTLPATFR